MSPQVKALVESAVRLSPLGPLEQFALFGLAWYAMHRNPRTFVEIGNQSGYVSAMVATAFPSVEIYGIDPWIGISPPIFLACNSILHGHSNGYARFVSGDPETCVQRLLDSAPKDFSIDLALVRTNPRYGDAKKNATLLAARLAPGGAIVVSSNSPEEFSAVWACLTERPGWSYVLFGTPPSAGLAVFAPFEQT